MILVHGIMGNPKELAYIHSSIEREFVESTPKSKSKSKKSKLVVHSAECNAPNSLDGIEAGGLRLATEINTLLKEYAVQNSLTSEKDKIALSILGFSLGGMYSRYALPFIDWTIEVETTTSTTATASIINVIPNVFVTAATPHLGISKMTYCKLPTFLEPVVAWYLGQTGKDLFRRRTRHNQRHGRRWRSRGSIKEEDEEETPTVTTKHDNNNNRRRGRCRRRRRRRGIS